MCLEYNLDFDHCRHTRCIKVPCSGTWPCQKPYSSNYTSWHYGECSDCLGQLWPMGTFEELQEEPSCQLAGYTASRASNLADYAQSILDWVCTLLISKVDMVYNQSVDEGNIIYDPLIAKYHLRTYYDETSCRHCGNVRRPSYLEPCSSCPSMLAENANLGNPVSQYRLKVTKEVFNKYYHPSFQNGLYQDNEYEEWTTEIVTNDEKTNPARPVVTNLAYRVIPGRTDLIADCRKQGHAHLLRWMNGFQKRETYNKKPTHEVYHHCAAFIVNIISNLMGADMGLTSEDKVHVIDLLHIVIPHPEEPSHIVDVNPRAFQMLMVDYLSHLADPQQFFAGLAESVMLDFQQTEARHRQAVALSCQSPASIYLGRLLHYGRIVPPHSVGPDWKCPVCLDEPAESTREIVQLNSCRHHYHLLCLRDWVLQVEDGKNECGVCRGVWDGLPRDDWEIYYDIDWRAAAVFELGGAIRKESVVLKLDGEFEIDLQKVEVAEWLSLPVSVPVGGWLVENDWDGEGMHLDGYCLEIEGDEMMVDVVVVDVDV